MLKYCYWKDAKKDKNMIAQFQNNFQNVYIKHDDYTDLL